jgi:hypothetical protein
MDDNVRNTLEELQKCFEDGIEQLQAVLDDDPDAETSAYYVLHDFSVNHFDFNDALQGMFDTLGLYYHHNFGDGDYAGLNRRIQDLPYTTG